MGRRLEVWSLLLGASLSSACPGDDDDPVGSGTGGDEDMPEADAPGPHGPACGEHVGGPGRGDSPDDLAWASQPAEISRNVTLRGDPVPAGAEAPQLRSTPGPSTPSTLTAAHGSVGATTQRPHIHERWGESRKLELSYCIGFMPGEGAEREANYHKTIRALHSTMAEWERVTGTNFVHIVADDTPDQYDVVPARNGGSAARAKCAPGTKAYFGMFSIDSGWEGVTTTYPQTWKDPKLEPLGGGVLPRLLQIDSPIIGSYGETFLLLVLRHELGHIIGFVHEEGNVPDQPCEISDPRPLTPVDANSVMTTPDQKCDGLLSDDADHLTPRDRLSAFFLEHTPRARFETRSPSLGYRFSGVLGEGAEILWHTEGSTEGSSGGLGLGLTGSRSWRRSFPIPRMRRRLLGAGFRTRARSSSRCSSPAA